MAAAVRKKLDDGATLDELTDEEHLLLYREAMNAFERKRSLLTEAERIAELRDMVDEYKRQERLRIEALNLELGRSGARDEAEGKECGGGCEEDAGALSEA